MLVLQRFLDGGQRRPCGLPLPRVVAILGIAVAGLLHIKLPPQPFQIEAAQGIGAQTAALEGLVLSDLGAGLQQLRGLAEGVRGHAIALQALEDEERLEGGVGGDASRHAPG